MKKEIRVLVEGGKATPGPPLGPALGPLGVRIDLIVNEINKKTKNFEGMKVPVIITIDLETQEFTVETGTPPTSALILKELGVEKGSKTKDEKVGDLPLEKVIEIAKAKIDGMNCTDLRSAVKQVLGTCFSMGVTVNGVNPKEIITKIDKGEINI